MGQGRRRRLRRTRRRIHPAHDWCPMDCESGRTSSSWLDDPIANSSMFVFPSITVPRARSRSTTVASYGATKESSIREPHEVRTPRVQKISLCAMGMPSNGLSSPARRRLSACAAPANAISPVTVMNEFRDLSWASIRSRKYVVSSTLENSFRRSASPRAEMDSVCMDNFLGPLGPVSRRLPMGLSDSRQSCVDG